MLRLEDLFMTYGNEKYAELGVFVDLLRALNFLHHTHHWQTNGATFYGDHLLFERLYTKVLDQIDSVGERAVGLGGAQLVPYRHSLTNMPVFLGAIDEVGDISPAGDTNVSTKMVKKSLLAEKSFITAGEKMMETLKNKGLLTRGLEQLLGTILDEHETFVYLLKQRLTMSVAP